MGKKLLDYDPISGITTYHTYDPLSDESTFSYHADVDLDAHTRARNDESYSKDGIKKEMWHYAHIPDIILMQWHAEGIDITDAKALLAKVNSPEYAYLKLTTKHHGKKENKHFV